MSRAQLRDAISRRNHHSVFHRRDLRITRGNDRLAREVPRELITFLPLHQNPLLKPGTGNLQHLRQNHNRPLRLSDANAHRREQEQ